MHMKNSFDKVRYHMSYIMKRTTGWWSRFFAFAGFISAFVLHNNEKLRELKWEILVLSVIIALIKAYIIIWLIMVFTVFALINRVPVLSLTVRNNVARQIDLYEHEKYKGMYVERQIKYIREAKSNIYMSIHSLSDENKNVAYIELDHALRDALIRGVDVKIVAPDSEERVCGAYQMSEYYHIPIKFIKDLNKEELRYILIDGRVSVFSQQDIGYLNRLSAKYTEFESKELSKLMETHFNDLWNEISSKNYNSFLKDTICTIWKNDSEHNSKRLAKRLHIPDDYLSYFIEREKIV